MARPTIEQQTTDSLERKILQLQRDLDGERRDLKLADIVFATLLEEEGLTQVEAYVRAYDPQTDNANSLEQMACRKAGLPRISAERTRIKKKLEEEEMTADNRRLSVALKGEAARDMAAIRIYAIATHPSTPVALQLKSWDMILRMKHVDGFVRSGELPPENQPKPFDIAMAGSAEEARELLLRDIQRAITAGGEDVCPE